MFPLKYKSLMFLFESIYKLPKSLIFYYVLQKWILLWFGLSITIEPLLYDLLTDCAFLSKILLCLFITLRTLIFGNTVYISRFLLKSDIGSRSNPFLFDEFVLLKTYCFLVWYSKFSLEITVLRYLGLIFADYNNELTSSIISIWYGV